jgi:hypothetical protein
VRPLLLLLPVLTLASCATSSSSSSTSSTGPGQGLEVTSDDGAVLFRGNAVYTVRGADGGASQRVVAVPGVGELHVGVSTDENACRFVWSKEGLDRLVVFARDGGQDGGACADRQRDRLCFAGARFVRPALDASVTSSMPASLLVTGCADENDLLWGKIDGEAPATVGPRAWRQRCVRVRPPKHDDKKHACALTYLKKESVSVATHPASDDGFGFTWDGETWRACFLEAESGAYDLRLVVEDACGNTTPVHLAGDSSDLDD